MTEQTKMYNLPDDIIEKLLCSHCKAYVSCGPVKLQPDGDIICGRCSQLSNEDSTPQVLFEVAMAKFTFPCRYKLQGCKKRVLFNHAVEHEYECAYRTFCCPSLPYNTCLKDVSAFDVYSHFKEAHEDLILKNGRFKLEFERDVQCNLLMTQNSIIVAIQYIYDSIKKILHLDVKHFSHDDKKNVYYKLQIVSGCDSDRTVNWKERQCDAYESHTLNMQSAATLIMDNYLSVLEDPNFLYINVNLRVNVKSSVQNDNNISSVITSEIQSMNADEEKALSAWNKLEHTRCGYCHSFIIPPVLWKCRYYENPMCDECRINMKGTGIEEKKIEVKNYPCSWRRCTFIGTDSNIEKHIESCKFQSILCPVSPLCREGYFTLNNRLEHMQRHGTYCSNPEKVIINLFCEGSKERQMKVYFTFFENRVIAFTCNIHQQYQWSFSGKAENLKVDIYCCVIYPVNFELI